MSRIRTMIVEDEPVLLESLEKMITDLCPLAEIVAKANDLFEARQFLDSKDPELLLLDIRLKGDLIFNLLKDIRLDGKEIIFITGFQEYAIHAIKCSALDYLLKPVQPAELQTAVNRAINKISRNVFTRRQLDNLLTMLEGRKTHYIALPLLKEIRFVVPSEIIRLEAQNNYTNFYLVSGEKIVVSKGLFEFKELLIPSGFIHPHKAHLVNPSFINSLVREDGITELLLKDKTHIPVSRLKVEEIKMTLTIRRSID